MDDMEPSVVPRIISMTHLEKALESAPVIALPRPRAINTGDKTGNVTGTGTVSLASIDVAFVQWDDGTRTLDARSMLDAYAAGLRTVNLTEQDAEHAVSHMDLVTLRLRQLYPETDFADVKTLELESEDKSATILHFGLRESGTVEITIVRDDEDIVGLSSCDSALTVCSYWARDLDAATYVDMAIGVMQKRGIFVTAEKVLDCDRQLLYGYLPELDVNVDKTYWRIKESS